MDAPRRPATASPARESVRSADALLRHLEWTVIRRLDGLLQGDYRTLFRGAGLDLADAGPATAAGLRRLRQDAEELEARVRELLG